MTEFNQDLYDQWIDAMKAAERPRNTWRTLVQWAETACAEEDYNADRLAAYKRLRFAYEEHEHLWAMNDKYGLGYKRD